jgi:preprotein translocase subunit SecE
VKPIAEKIAETAAKQIDSGYKDMALCKAILRETIKDLDQEFNKIKWVSDEEAWNAAIEAVRREIKSRYGV